MTRAETAGGCQTDERKCAVTVDGPSGQGVGGRVRECDVEPVGDVEEFAIGLLGAC